MLFIHLDKEFNPTDGSYELDLERGLLVQLWEMAEERIVFEDVSWDYFNKGIQKDYEMRRVSEVFPVSSHKFFKDVMTGDPVFLYKKPELRSMGNVLNKFKALYFYGFFEKHSVVFDIWFRDLGDIKVYGKLISDLMVIQKWPVRVNLVFNEKELLYTSFLSSLNYEVSGSLVKPEIPDLSKLAPPTPADLDSLKALLERV